MLNDPGGLKITLQPASVHKKVKVNLMNGTVTKLSPKESEATSLDMSYLRKTNMESGAIHHDSMRWAPSVPSMLFPKMTLLMFHLSNMQDSSHIPKIHWVGVLTFNANEKQEVLTILSHMTSPNVQSLLKCLRKHLLKAYAFLHIWMHPYTYYLLRKQNNVCYKAILRNEWSKRSKIIARIPEGLYSFCVCCMRLLQTIASSTPALTKIWQQP